MKLLFIPGSGSPREVWTYQSRHFADSIPIALPGHPDGAPCHTMEQYSEWLHDHVRQCGYGKVVLSGHSLGGAVAQLYALRYPAEVNGLVLIGTAARFAVSNVSLETFAAMARLNDTAPHRQYLTDITYRSVSPDVRSMVVEATVRIGPAVMVNDLSCCRDFDTRDRLGDIMSPALVICGTLDDKTPAEYSRYLVSNIRKASQVLIEGATHSVFLEKPAEVNSAIAGFLNGLD